MRKLLLTIIILLAMAGQGWGADYFACAAGNVNANNVWCTSAHANGSCSNDGTTEADTAAILVAGNSFYANGCTMVVTDSFTVTKISTEANGEVAGGQFTIALNTVKGKTITADITAGSTDCLAVSGASDAGNQLTIVGTITGSSTTAAKAGVYDTHTVGNVVVTGNVTAGDSAGSNGYYLASASGTVSITGTATGSSNNTGVGAFSTLAGAITITGNLVNGTRAWAAGGNVRWSPATPADGVTGNYIMFNEATDIYIGLNTDDASKALNTFYYIDPTDGTSDVGTATTGGGGGAWGF